MSVSRSPCGGDSRILHLSQRFECNDFSVPTHQVPQPLSVCLLGFCLGHAVELAKLWRTRARWRDWCPTRSAAFTRRRTWCCRRSSRRMRVWRLQTGRSLPPEEDCLPRRLSSVSSTGFLSSPSLESVMQEVSFTLACHLLHLAAEITTNRISRALIAHIHRVSAYFKSLELES